MIPKDANVLRVKMEQAHTSGKGGNTGSKVCLSMRQCTAFFIAQESFTGTLIDSMPGKGRVF
jgi:hypothetical protein